MSLFRWHAVTLMALGLTLQFNPVHGQGSEVARRFIGTWRLVSIINANGEKDPLRGPNPAGLIMYDPYGNMAVQIMPDRERPKFASNQATPEEAQTALLGYTAYFGTYSVDPGASTVTHHRQGNINPGAIGDYVRRYQFAGDDRLILQPLESQNQLTWERVK
jgi:Lipocalin-like domain